MVDPSREVARHEKQAAIKKNLGKKKKMLDTVKNLKYKKRAF